VAPGVFDADMLFIEDLDYDKIQGGDYIKIADLIEQMK